MEKFTIGRIAAKRVVASYEKGESLESIASTLGVKPSELVNALHSIDMPLPDLMQDELSKTTTTPKVQTRRLHSSEFKQYVLNEVANGKNATQVCGEHGISVGLFYKWRQADRIKRNVATTRHRSKRVIALVESLTRDKIIAMYCETPKLTSLCERLDVTISTLYTVLAEFNLTSDDLKAEYKFLLRGAQLKEDVIYKYKDNYSIRHIATDLELTEAEVVAILRHAEKHAEDEGVLVPQWVASEEEAETTTEIEPEVSIETEIETEVETEAEAEMVEMIPPKETPLETPEPAERLMLDIVSLDEESRQAYERRIALLEEEVRLLRAMLKFYL